ncbi:MAG: L-seryl-tRNA selenium transferase [Armatimonadetes bacterium]|nr:L-seryl-tRNA selenium transferase [Armatimonadota bacterium]
METIYEQLGVRTIINATGPATRLSGSLLPPEVAEAMRAASQYCVDIAELQARAGQIIAEITGAEAAYVTSGAAAGLLLGTAACVTGLDPGKMNRLPDTSGMKNEVIVPRSHRNFYDHAVRSTGVRLIEVGIADRFSGAGVRDTEAWEIADAITERTAAVLYVAHAHALPPLSQVTGVARTAGVPVLVDAAGQLPPASNLQRFLLEGADLVVFSGGKAIRGPQSSGILCGRRDLISAAALQHLDLDILWEQWNPPPSLIAKDRLPGAPQHGIGRPCKVGKEEIVGLVTALRRFVAEDPEARRRGWVALLERIVSSAGELPAARFELGDQPGREVPSLTLHLGPRAALTALELVQALQDGDPPIQASPTRVRDGVVGFGPMCLREEDPERIGARLHALLAASP